VVQARALKRFKRADLRGLVWHGCCVGNGAGCVQGLGLVLLLRNMLVAVRDAEAGPKIVMLFVALHDA
jgi:hypothetical protein